MPSDLPRRLLRVYAHDTFLSEPMAALEAERRARLPSAQDANIEKVRPLMQLQGLGSTGAWLLMMAFLGWRTVQTRRAGGG
jgi:hypothetical protein